MAIKEIHKDFEGENGTVHDIYYYVDGLEIAFYRDGRKEESRSKVLYLNSDLMAVPSYDPASKNMTLVQRAKSAYESYFQEIENKHPGIPQVDF